MGGIWQGVASLLLGCLRPSGGLATSGRCATKFFRNWDGRWLRRKGFVLRCRALSGALPLSVLR